MKEKLSNMASSVKKPVNIFKAKVEEKVTFLFYIYMNNDGIRNSFPIYNKNIYVYVFI